MTKQSNNDEEAQTSGTEANQIPCLHDVRLFVNVMPLGLSPALLKGTDFFPTCPYFSIPGSKYCRPHTIMNDAVTPELTKGMNVWMAHTIKGIANGYTYLAHGTMFRDSTWPHRLCTNGIPRRD